MAGIIDSVQGSVNNISNKIKNPFSLNIEPTFYNSNDFPNGLIIEEILENGKTGEKIVLAGNWLPKIPFTFGGSQRIKKEFYSGYSEPSVQVYGPEEDDLAINGTFKDKRFTDDQLLNASSEMQKLIDSVRIRGNVVRLILGDFERYAIILRTKFDLTRLSKIDYSITFSVIGFNAPKNAVFLQRKKEIPFQINKDIIPALSDFENASYNIPPSVPLSIGDIIRNITSTVASAINVITGFVDTIFSTVQDIKSAVNRALGLIKNCQNKLRQYKNQMGSLFELDPSKSIASRYAESSYSSSAIRNASFLTVLLQRMREVFLTLVNDLPLARHRVITGDNLQKISLKYYGNSDSWKKIMEYNDLNDTDLTIGRLLDIPRV